MARRKTYDGEIRLYGTQEAADYLGITRRNLSVRLMREQIVEPVARLLCGPIWSQSQLDEQLLLWAEDPPRSLSVDQAEQFKLTRRLRTLERRWEQLVASSIKKGDRKELTAVWSGQAAANRRKGKRSALASYSEARRALAEAKLLRLVAELRDKDPVFASIGEELDEAAKLRKRIKTIQNARAKRSVETERVGSHSK